MGALIAKLLSFFGFRTAIAEEDDYVSRSSIRLQGHGSRQGSLSGNDHPSAADLTIRKRGSVTYKNGHIVKKIQWFGPAQAVFISGSWMNWSEKVELTPNPNSGTVWEAEVEFPADVGSDVELKFIVDEEWKSSPEMPTRVNDQGTLNNIVILKDTPL